MLLRRVFSSLAVLIGLGAQAALAAPSACSTYSDNNIGTVNMDGSTASHVFKAAGSFDAGDRMSFKVLWSKASIEPLGAHTLNLTGVVESVDAETTGPTALSGEGGEFTLDLAAFTGPVGSLAARVDLANGFEPPNQTVQVTVYATCTPVPDPIIISPPDGSNINADEGSAVLANFVASGGVGPNYVYSLVAGAAPSLPSDWMTINPSTGTLTGTPLAQGTYNFGVTADDVGTPETPPVTQYYTLSVAPPVLVGNFFHRLYARVGEPIEIAHATPTGGVPPYSYEADVSGIPNSAHALVDGHLSVTPTTVGTFSYTLTVRDSAGRTDTLDRELTVVERLPGEMWMDPAPGALTGGDAGAVYGGADFDAHHAPDPLAGPSEPAQFSYSVSAGSLPAGLVLDSATGVVSGTPSAGGTSTFTIRAVTTNIPGSNAIEQEYSITIAAPKSPVTLTPEPGALPAGVLDVAYSMAFSASGGAGAITFAVDTGTLPPGLSLDGDSGVLSGTPTADGSYSFSVRAQDGFGQSDTNAYTIAVTTAPPASLALALLQRDASDLVAETSSGAITDMVEQAINDAFSGNPAVLSGSGDGGQMNFVAVRQPARSGAEEALAALLPEQRKAAVKAARATLPGVFAYDDAAPSGADAVDAARWSAWAGFRVRQWDFSAALDDLGGTQTNVLGGLSFRVSPQMVAGAFAGYETFDFDNDAGSDFTGEGYTGGLYAAYRPESGLRFNAHVAASSLSYRMGVTGATAGFDATRITAGLGVSGATRLGSVLIEPSLRYTGTWETQGAYVDSLGTAHAGRSFELGKLSAGVRASRTFVLGSGAAFTPFIGAFADYRHSAGDTSAVDAALDDLSGRVSLGFNAAMAGNSTLSLNGDVSGIGLEDAISYGVRAQFNLRF